MIRIDIFLIYGLQIWKGWIKSKTNPKVSKNINKEDLLASGGFDFDNGQIWDMKMMD